jgi:hypothetical protein
MSAMRYFIRADNPDSIEFGKGGLLRLLHASMPYPILCQAMNSATCRVVNGAFD